MGNKKIHKAWFVMAGCCCLMACSSTGTCISFLTGPVTNALGFTRASFVISSSISAISTALILPLWGKLIPTIGIKTMVVCCGTILGAAFISMGHFTSLFQFYTASVFIGAALPAISLATSISINNWFADKKGIALGISMAFSGVGGAVLSPILVRVIQAYSWRTGYLFLGIISILLTIPVALFVLQEHPARSGLKAYGAKDGSEIGQHTALSGVSFSVALKSMAFWGIMVGLFCGSIAIMGFLQHLPVFLVDKGLSSIQAGSIVSITMVAMLFYKIFLGWLNDRIGTKKTFLIPLLCGGIGLLLMLFIKSMAMAVVAFCIFAAGMTLTTIFPALLTVELFGQKDFASLYSFLTTATIIGAGVGAPMYGRAFDVTGSYTVFIYAAIITIIIVTVMIPFIFKAKEKLLRV